MKNFVVRWGALCVVAAVFVAAMTSPLARADAAGGVAEDVLYSDADGQSSATVVQVLPNSPSTQMILTNVKSIRVHQEILIIAWGGSATTLLPKQFVSEITVNKRVTPPPAAAATEPARR
jgi:hypothetical protein